VRNIIAAAQRAIAEAGVDRKAVAGIGIGFTRAAESSPGPGHHPATCPA